MYEGSTASIERALEGGITIFQFREKGEGALTGEERICFAKELQAICKNTVYHSS